MEAFGRYQLIKQIAVGGMGEIFLARSASIDGFEKDLVIKRILRVHGDREHFVSMFLDEARVSMSLSHQNIVQVFDFGEIDARYYIAMEHVYGCDLKRLLQVPSLAAGGIPFGLALYVMREVAKALDYAHNKRNRGGELLGLVHRDISPDNVLVSFDGSVKITDFGIAKMRGQLTKLQPGAVLGKPHYMAPEVADGSTADARADVFSCGAVLWELLVGQKMYQQGTDSNEAFYERIRQGKIKKPSEVNRDVPRQIEKLVMRSLSRDPKLRHASARELGEDLHDVLTSKYRDTDSYELQGLLNEHRPELKVVGFDQVARPSIPVAKPRSAKKLAETMPVPALGSPPASGVSLRAPDAMAPATEPDIPPRPSQPSGSATAREPMSTKTQFEVPRDIDFVPEPEEAVLSPALDNLASEFDAKPSLWLIVDMGELARDAHESADAITCFRVAAAKFAQHGLLAQSLLCAKLILETHASSELMQEVGHLPRLAGYTDATIIPYLFRSGGVLAERLASMVASATSADGVAAEAPPLLTQLSRDGFAQLARLAPLQRFTADQPIVVQGDQGQTMYLILSGRVLVSAAKASGDTVNIASLTAGEFFGENGFFSGGNRNATVVALEPTAVIEIDRALYDRVMQGSPQASTTLLRFYKERILDRILATSSTFGLFKVNERRELLSKMTLRSLPEGTVIQRKGAVFEGVCLIKKGTVEFRVGEEEPVVLGPGSIVGELDAVTAEPAKVDAVTAGEFEAFVLRARDLREMIGRVSGRREAWLRACGEEPSAPATEA